MRSTLLSLHSILIALDLDAACLPLIEQAPEHDESMRAHTPEAVYRAIQAIGDTLNASQKANALVENLEERINIIAHKLKFITDDNKPHVLFLADISPIRTITDDYLENLTRLSGGIPLGTPTDVANADVVILVSERPIPQLLASLPVQLTTPEWSQTAAAKNGNIYLIHHPDHLRQPGALIADDAEILAEILYPKQFFFGRDEDAWMKFEGQ